MNKDLKCIYCQDTFPFSYIYFNHIEEVIYNGIYFEITCRSCNSSFYISILNEKDDWIIEIDIPTCYDCGDTIEEIETSSGDDGNLRCNRCNYNHHL